MWGLCKVVGIWWTIVQGGQGNIALGCSDMSSFVHGCSGRRCRRDIHRFRYWYTWRIAFLHRRMDRCSGWRGIYRVRGCRAWECQISDFGMRIDSYSYRSYRRTRVRMVRVVRINGNAFWTIYELLLRKRPFAGQLRYWTCLGILNPGLAQGVRLFRFHQRV